MPDPRRLSRLERLDGRIKLLLLLAGCFACQYMPPLLLPLWLLLLASPFMAKETRTIGNGRMLRGGAYFIGFWLAMTMGSSLLAGDGWRAAAATALPLGGKLLAFTLLGVLYVGVASPMETGRAAAWCLRPLLGRGAWKPALAVALTAWFLPVTLRLAAEVLSGMRARGLRLSWRKKGVLLAGTSLRILERRAAELAAGLASRRLDDWRSWSGARSRM